MHACMYVLLRTHMHAHICMHVCIHMYIHTYTYVRVLNKMQCSKLQRFTMAMILILHNNHSFNITSINFKQLQFLIHT